MAAIRSHWASWLASADLGATPGGVSFNSTELASKKLELLHELVPKASVVAMLVNPRNPNAESSIADTQAAANVLGVKLFVVNAVSAPDLNAAFADTHRSGVLVEELTIASLIHTLSANIPGILKVKVLVDGKERDSLAGHADLSDFYDVSAVSQLAIQLQSVP